MVKKRGELTPEEKRAIRDKVGRYYGVKLGEPTAEDEERLKMIQRLWLEQQQRGKRSDGQGEDIMPID